ncbi:MAG: DUF815 domain-containing protein [Candidatus Tectomicrobia bacterium]|nr:DUF815 domain-containing protein [Candidatus Tectomicrobia bacterium]
MSRIDALLAACGCVEQSVRRLYLETRLFQTGIGGLLVTLARMLQSELLALLPALQSFDHDLLKRRLLVFLPNPAQEPTSLTSYQTLFNMVAARVEMAWHPVLGTPLQDCLLEALLADDNLFHRKAEVAPLEAIGPGLIDAYEGLLAAYSTLLHFDAEGIMTTYQAINREIIDDLRRRELLLEEALEVQPLPRLQALQPCPLADHRFSPAERAAAALKSRLLEGPTGLELAAALAAFFSTYSRSELRNYLAFRWVADGRGGRLLGVHNFQDVRFEHLVGYEERFHELIRNTSAFLAGKEANNVLLYGARGTGKSSSVRALLNGFHEHGLRMIEIDKEQIFELHEIIACVRDRKERFIIFCDDLSFESDDTSYKPLKVVLDGSLEARAGNVLFYATSNTKDLVKRPRLREGLEWSEERAILDEKRGIDDRFGLKIHFTIPDQALSHRMVLKHAELRGLRTPTAELLRQFRIWCGMNNHDQPSGRSARDFITWFMNQCAGDGESPPPFRHEA